MVVTISVEKGWCQFVIDSHHKLQAYKRLKLPPNVVNIQKNKTVLHLEEGLKFLQGQPIFEVYKKVKIAHDKR